MRNKLIAVLIALGLWCVPVQAQIALDGYTGGQWQVTDTTLTFSHTVTSNTDGLLTVCTGNRNGASETTGVTFNGDAMTKAADHTDTTYGVIRASLWYLKMPDTGTHDVEITTAATPTVITMGGAASFTGVDQTTPVSNPNTADGNSVSSSVTITSSTGSMVVDCFYGAGANSLAAVPTQTGIWSYIEGAGTTDLAGQSRASGAASVAMAWDFDGVTEAWVAMGMSMNAASGGASAPKSLLTLGVGQ